MTLNKLGDSIAEAESRISRLEDDEAKRSPMVEQVVKQNMLLQEKLSALEGYSRHQNIRIFGVMEGMEGQDFDAFLKIPLHESLEINSDDWYKTHHLSLPAR